MEAFNEVNYSGVKGQNSHTSICLCFFDRILLCCKDIFCVVRIALSSSNDLPFFARAPLNMTDANFCCWQIDRVTTAGNARRRNKLSESDPGQADKDQLSMGLNKGVRD